MPDSTLSQPTGKPYHDYNLQVWIIDGLVADCGHPDKMRPGCCNADRYAGLRHAEAIRKHAAE